jgi:hypothetical protein
MTIASIANATFFENRDTTLEPTMIYPGEGPNLVIHAGEFPSLSTSRQSSGTRPTRRRSTKTKFNAPLMLIASPPIFERNRATVILTHGFPNLANPGGRKRRYLVASDLSKESSYAIEWAIGTLLRDGDELILVFVMETESKRK